VTQQLSRVGEKTRFRVHSDKNDRRYEPSYDWGSHSLGDRHDRIAEAVWHIPGWLEPEDALKLYELAYFATGPILEIGMYCGRSTTILATAVADRGSGVPIVSLDIDPLALSLTARSLRMHAVHENVVLACASIEAFIGATPSFSPRLVFIDANHAVAAVMTDIEVLGTCVTAGSLLLFHDYLPMKLPDTAGFPVSPGPIEVKSAIDNSWISGGAQFAGTFGASALFRVCGHGTSC
jgi:cephalosporin hydroxylase